MACRNVGKCEDCKADLQQAGHATGGSLFCEKLDLEDYVSIRRFSRRLSSRLAEQKRPLSVLVNNAGKSWTTAPPWLQHGALIAGLQRHASAHRAGVMGVKGTARCPDQHLRPNVYGPFLLQQLLLPLMAPDGRIVNLASRAHKHTRCLHFDKSTGQLSHHPWHWWAARQSMATMLDGPQKDSESCALPVSSPLLSAGFGSTAGASSAMSCLRVSCSGA